eukprot:TRINITY_DN135809_c1_g1_i1.p1 TRINITY_DN135809_c1_g1~~TRINITY_DN135809_c1_g1_i1.p1  ORF type:complete len:444 (-),score=44.87 TRINITY_DN135809_c1_g1_i1:1026-2357(-)
MCMKIYQEISLINIMENSELSPKQIVLKLSYANVTKRSRVLLGPLKEIHELIKTSFPELSGKAYEVSYVDPEGDNICVSNENDWLEAVRCSQENGMKTLKLNITNKELPKKPKKKAKKKVDKVTEDKASEPKHKKELAVIIQELAKEEAGKFSEKVKELIAEEIQKLSITQSQPVHDNIACDSCNMQPIRGIHYKCTECPDYDLCEACEAQGIHSHHLFLKIPKPEQAPVSILTQPLAGFPMMRGIMQGIRHFGRRWGRRGCWPRCCWGRRGKGNMGIVVGDKIINLAAAPGEIVHAQWMIRNESEWPWPQLLYIDRRKGEIEFEKILISDKMNNDQKEMTLNIPIKAPQTAGKYKIVLVMHDENGIWIGEKLKIHLSVLTSEMKTGMVNTDYFKASQLSDQGFGSFEDCLSALRKTNGDLVMARDLLKQQKQTIMQQQDNFE